ncbi:MAG: hypothetical protein ACLUTA_17370 [Blautia wexlerae]
MEKIALQMPLSAINRPSWDRKLLKENGFRLWRVDYRNLEACVEPGGEAELSFYSDVYDQCGKTRREYLESKRR